MHDMLTLFSHAQAMAEQRMAEAERARKIRSLLLSDRAETRLRKAAAAARRDRLGRGTAARELFSFLRGCWEN